MSYVPCPNDHCRAPLEIHETSTYETSYCSSCGYYEKIEHNPPKQMPSTKTGYEKNNLIRIGVRGKKK